MSLLLNDNNADRKAAFATLMDQWAKHLCSQVDSNQEPYGWCSDTLYAYDVGNLLTCHDVLILSSYRDEIFGVGTDQSVCLGEDGMDCAAVLHSMAAWAVYGEMSERIEEASDHVWILRARVGDRVTFEIDNVTYMGTVTRADSDEADVEGIYPKCGDDDATTINILRLAVVSR